MQDFKSDFYLPQFKFLPFFYLFDWQKVYCPLKLISINYIFILKSFFFQVVSVLAAVPDILWLNGPLWLIV